MAVVWTSINTRKAFTPDILYVAGSDTLPSTDPSGGPVAAGTTAMSTDTGVWKVYTGSAWATLLSPKAGA